MKKRKKITVLFFLLHFVMFSQSKAIVQGREHISIDRNWKFAFGHPSDTKKDFNTGTAYFSYLAKAGFGDGAASANFDDRSWRNLNVPHDWAVEQDFSSKASFSHGFKAIGRNFPNKTIGWYRKKITIPESDLGRRIYIAFDGVFRNSIVWINGHYLGNQDSGYLGFEYDITDYINYGGENSIAVRVDASMEEGWFYEGAGIYRHVWLNKTNNLHVPVNGTFVQTKTKDKATTINALVSVTNEDKIPKFFKILQTVFDASGKKISENTINSCSLKPREVKDFTSDMKVQDARLWSIENPYLYKMVTSIYEEDKLVDNYETTFGIRTIRFDANEGFFLNGKHLKIKGTNNHQDHAGVGTAIPDALQEFRIKTLKSFGSNAYRCSHNPPTPELLDICDRLGMLVIDENRLMGSTQTQLGDVKKLIERDRNHPSIISWSVGNEEWGIENNIVGARIASTMQSYVKSIDSTRYVTAAFSGGIGSDGITTVMDLLGINYIVNKSTDEQHKLFSNQFIWGTEEGSTNATRGEYYRDNKKHIMPAYDKAPSSSFISIEQGWKHYNSRPYLAGMFIWTGFDYRGEPTPFEYPSVGSYFGMVDQCGFYKDTAWYLKAWWQDEPVLHLLPHWNWAGKENQDIEVWAYSNCDEVELFLNKKSLGKKTVEKDGHLGWNVKYNPGTLEAIGYKNGKKNLIDVVKTTGVAVSLKLESDKIVLDANKNDVAVIKASTQDKKGLQVPIADDEVTFSITGPAEIIGVGNGNPTSLEADKFLETITVLNIENLKEKEVESISSLEQIKDNIAIVSWENAFREERDSVFGKKVKAILYRTDFELSSNYKESIITFFYNSLGKRQSIFINGKQIANAIPENKNGDTFVLDKTMLRSGKNTIAILTEPLLKVKPWDVINQNAGSIQILTSAEQYKRKLFNGLAQVIIQTTGEAGEVKLTATSKGLKQAVISIKTIK
ncbi:beta-galactosidase GalA [Flavobacterium sp. AED]|uniref:beta-galactosidase GalA n=1 Tax=Flavobacterium sp. AED TaxID=1423323 RepID=UPI00057EC24A|nr:beta-galactosidase GalA [Flavobacterium sp. AED]KIA85538.1 beta-galactosidase [Flavobacterium sp. AED]